MIRSATHHDINAMMSIGERVIAASTTYRHAPMDKTKTAYMVRRCISDRSMAAFVAEVDGKIAGFILGIQEEHFFSKARYATDLAFCVLPNHADQAVWLLRRFIRWAKASGASSITLGVSTGMDDTGRIGELYQRHGLAPAGGIYSLHLPPAGGV